MELSRSRLLRSPPRTSVTELTAQGSQAIGPVAGDGVGKPLAIVGGIFLVGENVADYVLAPRIIGQRVKLNPVWLMFALFAFGSLFGFIGLLVAVPLAAALGVLLRFAIRKYGTQALGAGATPSG